MTREFFFNHSRLETVQKIPRTGVHQTSISILYEIQIWVRKTYEHKSGNSILLGTGIELNQYNNKGGISLYLLHASL